MNKAIIKKNISLISVDHGFTLVELMITLVIAGIISAALYATYLAQQRSYIAQEAVAEMQQNIRGAKIILERDIRMAGYNPGGGAFGFVNSTTTFDNGTGTATNVTRNSTSIAFTADLDGDGNIDRTAQDTNGDGRIDMADMEQIAYRLNGMSLQRYVTTSGALTWLPVAQNIERIEFQYLDGSGATTTVAANIRAVRVSILARASRPDRKFLNNRVYTPASGNTWDLNGAAAGNAPNDNFRRRLLITTIQCRNMGL